MEDLNKEILKTNIKEIYKIEDPKKFFKSNLNSMYLLNSFGLRKFNEDDDIGIQIKNLKCLNYIFNVNEILIFRTFLNNQIIIYELLENRLHIIKTNLNIVNVYLTIENYILLKYDNFEELEILNYKNLKSVVLKNLSKDFVLLYEYLFDLIFQVIKEPSLFVKHIEVKKENNLTLPVSTVIKNKNKNINTLMEAVMFENNMLSCEKIWGIFVLQTESCYSYSIIENNKRIFKYYTIINNKKKYFESILDMIIFLQKNFYHIIKECCFLIQ